MKAKDLEQGKFYASVEYLSENVERFCRWYITLREGDNIRVKLVERLMDNFLSFNYTSEIRYSVNFFKDISFTECGKKHFTLAVEDIIKELQAIEL